MSLPALPEFRGSGDADALGIPPRWHRSAQRWTDDPNQPGHPAGYIADPGLVDAVNTAVALGKPLLLTGRPGTGKSELAERVAWEFGLGAVLRFEAQSLTEAQDLFYRFDLVGQMADAQLGRGAGQGRRARRGGPRPTADFLSFGPLGKAILRATPQENADLLAIDHQAEGRWRQGGAGAAQAGFAPSDGPRRSVVLIDEIDKAARDVPNDLLNGIQRMEFTVRELQHRLVRAADDDALRPIVLITSNAERDLPEPFLRRCAYFHIPEPDIGRLRVILRSRVFPEAGSGPLPPFYEGLLDFYVAHRDAGAGLAYTPGTSELLDWSQALRSESVADQGDLAANGGAIARTLAAVAKHPDDRRTLVQRLRDRGVELPQGAAGG